MHAASFVALATFRESVRDRVFYNLVLFAVLLVAASLLIGQLTAGQDVKIIKDLSLAATSLFGLCIAIVVGIGLVSKEVDRRSVYPLLAKPVRRSELIVGKYLGLLLTLLVNVVVMTAAIYLVLFYLARGVPPNIQQAWDAPALDPAPFAAEWEIRFGPGNRFRVLYDIDEAHHAVHIVAVGEKEGNRLLVGGEELEL